MVYYSCREVGVDWKSCKYALLGDDIVISNPQVAERYLELLVALGVDYSPSKTIRSQHLIEFAKRLIYKGVEISPFPVSSLRECKKSYYVLVHLLIEYASKGWQVSVSVPSAVSSFYSIVNRLPSRMTKKIEERAEYSECVMLITRKAIPAGEVITNLARKAGYSFSINDTVGASLLSNIAIELFTESNPENNPLFPSKRKSIGLGPFAIGIVEYLSGY
jgi:hypothetical protein